MIRFIRRFKPAYALYNFFRRNHLKHNVRHYRKLGIRKPYFASVSSRDFAHLDNPQNLYDRMDSRTEMPNNPAFNKLDPAIQAQLLTWSGNGYVILRNYFSHETVDAINAEVDRLIESKQAEWRYGRVMFAFRHSIPIQSAALDSRLLNILNILMDREVELFQSINFIRASEQRAHSDAIHMTTYPAGNLIAVWVALEEITMENGPLHYYPGSHKLPYIMNPDFGNAGSRFFLGNKSYQDYEDKVAQVIRNNDLRKEVFLAQKGDLLIWHANLLHGGEPLIDMDRTRKSMVFHYYSKDVICYHEITERPTLKGGALSQLTIKS